MRLASILLILVLFVISACKKQPEITPEEFKYQELKSNTREVSEVLYSMYLPTDMADVFARSGANYNPNIPAPIDNITLYTESEQIAIMLGVYGVDITYMKLLGQALPAAQYYKSIELLSERINIPSKIFQESSKQLELYFGNEDSLAVIIENIYKNTDLFFKETGEDNLAALSLLGGWIEAMHIGVAIFESDSGNNVLAERILQQKYSLNSIYALLSNHQESLSIRGYILMLKKLRRAYETVEIRYQKEGFSVDTTQKKLQTYSAQIRYDDRTMDDLLRIIPQIRKEIISPRLKQE